MLAVCEELQWNKMPENRKKLLSTVASYNVKSDRSIQLTGLHTYCDWCIGRRRDHTIDGGITRCWGNPNVLPRTIFIACSCFKAFFRTIYPRIPVDHRYCIIIGDEDCTIPECKGDVRYSSDSVMTIDMWTELVADPRIIHIFCTHLEIPATDKYSAIPVGFSPRELPGSDLDWLLNLDPAQNIMRRPLKIRGCCRIRKGAQWKDRRVVRKLCRGKWNRFSNWNPIPTSEFFLEIQRYPFLLCPHGGGIDPNPKAFSAIYAGTIPIMKRFVNCDILYKDLPVVFVNQWRPNAITRRKLKQWLDNLRPYFENSVKRSQVLEKLTSRYWFKKVREKMAYREDRRFKLPSV